MPRLEEFSSPTVYYEAVREALFRDECLNNVAIGVGHWAVQRETKSPWEARGNDPERDFFAAVWRDDGELDMAVWRTAPHPVSMSSGSDEGVMFLAHELRRRGIAIHGSNCSRSNAEVFAREVTAIDGCPATVLMEQRLFRLDRVIAPPPAPGKMVDATWDDVDLVRHWAHRFAIDCGLAAADSPPPRELHALERGGLRLWVIDGQPVAMAGSTRQSLHGASISWVYTPDAHRGRGHATSLVAALSQHYLDAGKEFCCLFTDLANSTSNKIYQAVGFRPIADFRRISFEAEPKATW